ncbi:MAG: AI-2E family transporter [Clostridia bacterium]|nr:AI-2E family transporter [Clostridia bacterium]
MKTEKKFWYYSGLIILGVLAYHLIGLFLPQLQSGINSLMPFFIAFITAYLLKYPVLWLENLLSLTTKKQKKPWQHLVSCLIVLIVFLGLLALLVAMMIPTIISNVTDVMNSLPQLTSSLTESLSGITQRLNIDLEQLSQGILGATDGIKQNADKLLSVATGLLSSFTGFLFDFVLYIVAAFMMLHGFDKMKQALKSGVKACTSNAEIRKSSFEFFSDCNTIIEKFIIVRLATSIGIGLVSYVGFLLFGLPYAMLLGIIIAVTNLIPYVGPFIGAAPVVLVALATKDLETALWVSVFMLICQQLEGNILTPVITSDALKVSPILVLLGIAVFGATMGIPGMILGAPLIAMLENLLKRIIKYKNRERHEDSVQ